MTDPRERFKSFWWGRRRKRKLAGPYTSDEDHAEVQMSYDIGDNMDELVSFAKAEVAKMLGNDPAPGDAPRPNPTPSPPSSRGQLVAGTAKCENCGKVLTPREVDYLNRNPSAIRWCYPCVKGGAAQGAPR